MKQSGKLELIGRQEANAVIETLYRITQGVALLHDAFRGVKMVVAGIQYVFSSVVETISEGIVAAARLNLLIAETMQKISPGSEMLQKATEGARSH